MKIKQTTVEDFDKAIEMLLSFQKIYNDIYMSGNDQTSKAALNFKDSADTLAHAAGILESEKMHYEDQEMHSQITLEEETGGRFVIGSDTIPLAEWAKNNGLDESYARQKARRGSLKTARKIGRDWFVNESEENTDNRKKH